MKSLGENLHFSALAQASFGAATIAAADVGGIVRAGLHEVYAPETAQIGAATGFVAALALRAAGERPILWVRQDFLDTETGALNASGLAGLGIDPARFILVRARDAEGVLRAGEQAARCAALGAVVIQPWGEPKISQFYCKPQAVIGVRKIQRSDPFAARSGLTLAQCRDDALERSSRAIPCTSGQCTWLSCIRVDLAPPARGLCGAGVTCGVEP